jgi:hypothetical protein
LFVDVRRSSWNFPWNLGRSTWSVGFDLTFVYLDLAVRDFVIPNTNLRDFTSGISHPGFHVRSSTSGVSRPGCLCLDAILAQLGEFGRACTCCTARQRGWLYRHDSSGALVRHQGLTHCQGLDSIREIPFGMFVIRGISSGIDVVRECQAHTRFNASTSKFQSMCNQCGTHTCIRKTVTYVSTVDQSCGTLGLIWENPEPPRVTCHNSRESSRDLLTLRGKGEFPDALLLTLKSRTQSSRSELPDWAALSPPEPSRVRRLRITMFFSTFRDEALVAATTRVTLRCNANLALALLS